MSVLDIFNRLTRRADLMNAMMSKIGVADEIWKLPDHAGVLRRAANRCLTCDKPDACAHWLAHEPHPAEAPEFCHNRDLFARARKKADHKSQPVA
ncbi:DUF6455 family protein [Hoeflea sp. YIM 152468]|uniref:DUF6455 family protein n=1 Tax=Hoeflea sp. YIM 152468 TaxID=3031759 RepID=UPI0023DA965A|nr:DUF6455 family protein [Hoeflea sp. YIM 152468]MDF1607074.1 DUF6455 family protein [Hoeflea sp. YIM 152468]